MNKTNENAMAATVAEMTITELYNDYLCDVDLKIEQADTLTMILQDNYLVWDESKLKSDNVKMYEWQESYKEIQMLIYTIRNAVWDAKKIMETVIGLDLSTIKELKGNN